jgi:hypothetical protein
MEIAGRGESAPLLGLHNGEVYGSLPGFKRDDLERAQAARRDLRTEFPRSKQTATGQ